jgi:hypothetical protein
MAYPPFILGVEAYPPPMLLLMPPLSAPENPAFECRRVDLLCPDSPPVPPAVKIW